MLVPTRERALALRDELPWRLPATAIIGYTTRATLARVLSDRSDGRLHLDP